MLLSIRPERAEAPSLGQRPRYLFMQTLPPCKGKSISLSGILCFCPYRAHLLPTFTQGVALGLGLAGLSARPTLLGACSSQPCLVLVRPNLAWCLFAPTLLGACWVMSSLQLANLLSNTFLSFRWNLSHFSDDFSYYSLNFTANL